MTAQLNEINKFAQTAIDAFNKNYNNDTCSGQFDITCRLNKVVNAVDENYPYKRYVNLKNIIHPVNYFYWLFRIFQIYTPSVGDDLTNDTSETQHVPSFEVNNDIETEVPSLDTTNENDTNNSNSLINNYIQINRDDSDSDA